jgi:hypothetical protein
MQKNYTEQETDKLINLYSKLGSEHLDEIAQELNRPRKSVIAKLVKLGTYVPMPKKYHKKSGKSKKQLLNELESIVKFDTTGLSGSTKEALGSLINFLENTPGQN